MKVFISWSGDRSRPLAEALRNWLPRMLQGVVPFLSIADAAKGGRWAQQLAGELEATRVGIVCLTPDNVAARWIHFEAGALSKAIDESKLFPLLFDVEQADVVGPLAQFQCATFGKEETWRVVQAMNDEAGDRKVTDAAILSETFDRWWPDLERQIASARAASPLTETPPRRDPTEILDEILSLVRVLAREHDIQRLEQAVTATGIVNAQLLERLLDRVRSWTASTRGPTLGETVEAMRQGRLADLADFVTDQTPGTILPSGTPRTRPK